MNKNDIIDQDQEIYSKVYKELNFIKTNLIMVFDKDKNLVTKTCLKRSQERNREEEKLLSINYLKIFKVYSSLWSKTFYKKIYRRNRLSSIKLFYCDGFKV